MNRPALIATAGLALLCAFIAACVLWPWLIGAVILTVILTAAVMTVVFNVWMALYYTAGGK